MERRLRKADVEESLLTFLPTSPLQRLRHIDHQLLAQVDRILVVLSVSRLPEFQSRRYAGGSVETLLHSVHPVWTWPFLVWD